MNPRIKPIVIDSTTVHKSDNGYSLRKGFRIFGITLFYYQEPTPVPVPKTYRVQVVARTPVINTWTLMDTETIEKFFVRVPNGIDLGSVGEIFYMPEEQRKRLEILHHNN